MIHVTEKSRQAVDALVELARRREPVPVPILEIAERRNVPVHVLEQVFGALRRSGILQSQRGVKGGYGLRLSPGAITVLDVVESVDGPLRSDALTGVWASGRDQLAAHFGETTIADLATLEANAEAAPMFHI